MSLFFSKLFDFFIHFIGLRASASDAAVSELTTAGDRADYRGRCRILIQTGGECLIAWKKELLTRLNNKKNFLMMFNCDLVACLTLIAVGKSGSIGINYR